MVVSRFLRQLSVVVVALPMAVFSSAANGTSEAPDDLLSAAMGMREAFGLPADVGYTRSVMASSSDVGTKAWGFPLTADEMDTLNLEGRTAFQADSQAVLDFARSLPEFGGAYFDQLEGGELVLQFTTLTDATRERISQLSATDGPTTRLEIVKYSFQALSDAMASVPAAMVAFAPSMELQSAGIREPENALVVRVLGTAEPTSQVEAMLIGQLGVPIAVEIAPTQLVPGTCPARNQLCQPERGGVIAESVQGEYCTMGFHITDGTEKEFVTAGHCTGTLWYQPQKYVYQLGYMQSDLYPANSVDMERGHLPDSQASTYIFGEGSNFIYGMSNPTTGELVYGSLGHTDAVRSGTVYTAWGSYLLDGYSLIGTNVHNLVTAGGDSGSPLYFRYPCCGRLYALATYSAGQIGGGNVDRWWARLTDAFQRWPGWDIYH